MADHFDPAADDLCPTCNHFAHHDTCHDGHVRADDNLWHCSARGIVHLNGDRGTVVFEHGGRLNAGPTFLDPV